jgi:hypothetical protein
MTTKTRKGIAQYTGELATPIYKNDSEQYGLWRDPRQRVAFAVRNGEVTGSLPQTGYVLCCTPRQRPTSD